jgi:two-component system chemotaxis sensor kinase CheA
MDELLEQFLIEGRELVAEAHLHLEALTTHPVDPAHIDGAFRAFHTLKGSVGLFDMAPAGRILHAGEDLLEQARSGTHALDRTRVAALIDIVDQIDRWIDATEAAGLLPADASRTADTLVAALGAGAAASTAPEPPDSGEDVRADWIFDLVRSAASIVGDEERALVAFRYRPDAQCFFRGDDPLRIATGVPDILALRVLPRDPWTGLEDFAPFECNLVVEGIAAAPLDAVRAAFLTVGDEVEILPVSHRAGEQVATSNGRTLRIDEGRIDSLADDVGELVLVGNALAHVSAEVGRRDAELGLRLREIQAAFDRNLASLHRNVTAVRMVSLAPALRRLPRMVREIATELGRTVSFTIEGERTEVDKAVADMLFEPLLHLVRNAVDHGVEAPEARRLAGKPGEGRVVLAVRRDGDSVVIDLSDDGAGMDADHIRAVAIERGVIDASNADALTQGALFELVFVPGFSTARAVSSVSGRGVGMDAVKTAVEAVGGRVAIASELGRGTTTTLRLPLTAITTRLLLVRAGGERYGVPFHAILETARLNRGAIVPIGAGQAFVLRDRTVPVVDLATLLGAAVGDSDESRLLIVQAAGDRVAVVVDGIDQPVDALVRPPAKLLAGFPAIAGTTVLGDGGIVLVLDPARLVA